MKYTVSEQADKKIQKDMDIIVKELGKIPGVLSIVLTGGFSRGEGPVKKVDGEFYPYNDYDIQVIAKKGLSKAEVDRISIEISNKLGYKGIGYFYNFKKEEQRFDDNFYIDLKWDKVSDLRKMLPRIRNYELRNKSMLLWGRDLRGLIPWFSLKEVPLSDAAKLLLDRMSQMIEYYSVEEKHDKEFLSYVIQQAYTACCTSLLMLVGKYEIGYGKAMEIFRESYKEDFRELWEKIPDLHLKIESYVNWKKNPVKLPYKDIKKEWFIAKKNILEVSKYFFSKFLNKEIKNVDEFSKSILSMGENFYGPYLKLLIKKRIKVNLNYRFFLPIVYFLMKYKYYKRLRVMGINKLGVLFGKPPDLVIFASLVYLISSLNEEGVDIRELKKGKKLLSRVYPVKGENWEDISLEYGNSYIAFFLQKI